MKEFELDLCSECGDGMISVMFVFRYDQSRQRDRNVNSQSASHDK